MRHLIRQVGQRFMIGFDGAVPSTEVKALLREYSIGGIILFARNIVEPEQIAELTRELQSLARLAEHEMPLLIAVDQEGGRVARMRKPWALWPSMRAIGHIGDEEIARQVGESLAEQLKACGICYDFAPVIDVDTNPLNPVIGDRSFGQSPELVGRLGCALIQGLQSQGVAACAKHFPGHGDTAVDSHLDLPIVDHGRSRLDDVELRPFRMAIEAGVASIMTAHVLLREIDDTLPATLAPRITTDLLRKDLAFAGVIVSDDLEMKAVAKLWRPRDAAALAASAGCDLMLVCANHDAQVEAIEGVIHAVEEERLSRTSLDDACERIRRLKERYLLPYQDATPRLARAMAESNRHRELAERIRAESGMSA
ncbi:MAG: beta-N-acetylhexosaminidase [Vicinamibacteria bacterium]|jgi:beta-N-acetylhexosaminidase|nr:beta-N-acetylhexosaminidase [Vicinamibacteria bacterium]